MWLKTREYRITLYNLIGLWAVLSAFAVAGEEVINDKKPFAEAHIILQLSDEDTKKQSTVLDIASNLIKHYGGPDSVDVEIVAFGPGIWIYEASNPLASRIESLRVSGVTFTVCKNTLDTLARSKGQAPTMVDGLNYVQTGVAHIHDQVKKGYVLIRP